MNTLKTIALLITGFCIGSAYTLAWEEYHPEKAKIKPVTSYDKGVAMKPYYIFDRIDPRDTGWAIKDVSRTITVDTMYYYLVGYSANSKCNGSLITGSLDFIGVHLNAVQLSKDIERKNTGLTKVHINGIYKFPNKQEYDYYYKGLKTSFYTAKRDHENCQPITFTTN